MVQPTSPAKASAAVWMAAPRIHLTLFAAVSSELTRAVAEDSDLRNSSSILPSSSLCGGPFWRGPHRQSANCLQWWQSASRWPS